MQEQLESEHEVTAAGEASSAGEMDITGLEDESTTEPPNHALKARGKRSGRCMHRLDDTITKSRQQGGSHRIVSPLHPHVSLLDAGNGDPFDTLPGGLYDETRLVHHCKPARTFMHIF